MDLHLAGHGEDLIVNAYRGKVLEDPSSSISNYGPPLRTLFQNLNAKPMLTRFILLRRGYHGSGGRINGRPGHQGLYSEICHIGAIMKSQ